MAQNVSSNYRKIIYSGDTQYNCILKINGNTISNSQIKSIIISNPIIDTTNNIFYVGSFIAQKLTITFRNTNNLDIVAGNEVNLTIGLLVDNDYEYLQVGKFLIDELSENYQTKCEIDCLDYSMKFKPSVDYSPAFINGKITIDNLLIWLCNYYGVELGEYPNINGTEEIGTYDSTVSGKQWISYIAEIKGCNAKIDRYGKLVLKSLKQASNITINALRSEKWELGEKFQISKVVYFDALRNFTYGDDTNNILYIRQENPFVKNTTMVENVYNELKDLTIYNANTSNYGDISLDPWDIITYTLGYDSNNNIISYPIINDNTLTYEMNIRSELLVKIPNKQQQITTNITGGNIKTEMKRVKAEVNNLTAEVEILSEKVIDISTTSNGIQNVSISNAAACKLKGLTLWGDIHIPVVNAYSNGKNYYIVGNENFIVNTFKLQIIQNSKIYKEIALPITDLYIYGTVHDTLIYDSGSFYINRTIGIDNNGSLYILKEPIKEPIKDIEIDIPQGNCSILTPTIYNSNISITYLNKNDYTDNFATQVQVSSDIKVANEQVLIESKSQILDNGDELIASINTTSTGKVKIKASDTISLEGAVSANGNFGVDTKGNAYMTSATINGGDIYLSNGGKVIGGDGMISNFQFHSSTSPLGYNLSFVSGVAIHRSPLNIDAYIPSNFKVISAVVIVYIFNTLNEFMNNSGTLVENYGQVNNIRLYKSGSMRFTNSSQYGEFIDETSSAIEISNAFGTNGYTASSTANANFSSADISSYLTKGGLTRIKVETANSDLSYETDSNVVTASQQSQIGYATLNVIGYISYT